MSERVVLGHTETGGAVVQRVLQRGGALGWDEDGWYMRVRDERESRCEVAIGHIEVQFAYCQGKDHFRLPARA